jgi:hypothetical protein
VRRRGHSPGGELLSSLHESPRESYIKKKKFSLIDNSYTTNIEASPLKENINNSTGLLSISFLDEKKSAKEEGR